MKYLDPKFSSRPSTDDYRVNWDRIFGRGDEAEREEEESETPEDDVA